MDYNLKNYRWQVCHPLARLGKIDLHMCSMALANPRHTNWIQCYIITLFQTIILRRYIINGQKTTCVHLECAIIISLQARICIPEHLIVSMTINVHHQVIIILQYQIVN